MVVYMAYTHLLVWTGHGDQGMMYLISVLKDPTVTLSQM